MPDLWHALTGILLASGLSLAIGLEREYYAKSAGMRTYAIVGMGSALFTVISKYGFLDTVAGDLSTFDGSRVAAQVVSGIGFLGAGLIFVRRDAVRGLTTAAGVWFVAAVGMAAAAGLHLIATAVTVLYVAVMFGIRPISRRMPHAKSTLGAYTVRYADGRGVLRSVMEAIGTAGLKVVDLRVLAAIPGDSGSRLQEVLVEVEGSSGAVAELGEQLAALSGVELVARRRSGGKPSPPPVLSPNHRSARPAGDTL